MRYKDKRKNQTGIKSRESVVNGQEDLMSEILCGTPWNLRVTP
jgi:hypothetical protein